MKKEKSFKKDNEVNTSSAADKNIDNERKSKNRKSDVPMHEKSAGFQNAIINLLDTVFSICFHFCRNIGFILKSTRKMFARSLVTFYKKHLVKYTAVIKKWMLTFAIPIKKAAIYVYADMREIGHFWRDVWRVLKEGYTKREKAGFFTRICDMFAAFGKGVKNNTHIFMTALNWSIPIIAVVLLWNVIAYVSTLNFAVSVKYNGENIGYISDETVYEQAQTRLQARMVYQASDKVIDVTPQFEVAVTPKTNLKSDIELTNKIIEISASDIVQATGLTIDGKFYGAVKNGDEIQTYLDSVLEKYKQENAEAKVQFTQDVKLESGLYVSSNIIEDKKILSMLKSETQGESYYTIKSGDTPSGIANANGISLSELVSLNPNVLTDCLPGHQLLMQTSKSFLSVSVIKNETYSQPIAYETEYTDDASLYKGTTRVVQEGQNGQKQITAEVSYVDGVEINRNILSVEVTKEAVTKKIRRGTKQMPTVSGNIGSISNYGLCLPVRGGYVSEYYGWTGTRYHRGVDIAFRGNGYGKTVVASHSGVVTYAGWKGSYGNLVIITDSSTGLQTYYAHNSRISVRVGQSVARGQYISNVGSTGNSTGNHVHFRLIINGTEVNPLKYLPPVS